LIISVGLEYYLSLETNVNVMNYRERIN